MQVKIKDLLSKKKHQQKVKSAGTGGTHLPQRRKLSEVCHEMLENDWLIRYNTVEGLSRTTWLESVEKTVFCVKVKRRKTNLVAF
jgi:hypothetical protein